MYQTKAHAYRSCGIWYVYFNGFVAYSPDLEEAMGMMVNYVSTLQIEGEFEAYKLH
jgi:hypothetical protein